MKPPQWKTIVCYTERENPTIFKLQSLENAVQLQKLNCILKVCLIDKLLNSKLNIVHNIATREEHCEHKFNIITSIAQK